MEANETKQAFDKVMSGEIVNTQNYTLFYDLCQVLLLLGIPYEGITTKTQHNKEKAVFSYTILLKGGE